MEPTTSAWVRDHPWITTTDDGASFGRVREEGWFRRLLIEMGVRIPPGMRP